MFQTSRKNGKAYSNCRSFVMAAKVFKFPDLQVYSYMVSLLLAKGHAYQGIQFIQCSPCNMYRREKGLPNVK